MRLTFEFAHKSATLPQAMSFDGMRAFGRLMRQMPMRRPCSLSDCESLPQRLPAVDLKFNKRLTWKSRKQSEPEPEEVAHQLRAAWLRHGAHGSVV